MRLAAASLVLVLVIACATAPTGAPAAPGILAPPTGAAERCAKGFGPACRDMGCAHLLGDGAKADDRLAAAYLTQGCEIGDPSSCGALAVLYALGRGVPQSDEQAAALSKRACEQGSALACSNAGVLVAEGASAPAVPGEDRGARIVKQFRTACDAGVADGCLNLGAALEAGRLAERDLALAARAYRRGCDQGSALACHRLASLARERPETAPGANVPALEVRACRAGIAPACEVVRQLAPPASARTPAPRLLLERTSFALGFPGAGGFDAGDLARGRLAPRRATADPPRPSATLRAAVPPPLRARLGVDLDPIAGGEDPPVDMLVALRRHQLGQCYEIARAAAASPTELYAVFFLDPDGHTNDLRTASIPHDAPLEECAAELLGGWEFPKPEGGVGGPYLVRFTYDPVPPGPAPDFAGPGTLRPVERDPGCVNRRLRLPPEYRSAQGSVTVKLAIDPAGRPALLHAVTPASDAILSAIGDAVARCGWAAGADASGMPATLWITLPVNLESR